jgi:hypothetical protein
MTPKEPSVQATGKLRYYQSNPPKLPPPLGLAPHSELLRTGRIARASTPSWRPGEKRYLTVEEVVERTGRRLAKAGETTHQRINSFHRAIQFPKMIFSRVFDEIPHLGYCHVTTASTPIKDRGLVHWSFYMANFSSEISEAYPFFENIRHSHARMYFAVAFEKAPGETLRIDRSLRKDGLLFRTHDPRQAMKNVLMLGAQDDSLRASIKKL